MSIKTRLSKLEGASAESDKRQAGAVDHTKTWLKEIVATMDCRPKHQTINVPFHNAKQWLEDTVKAINEGRA